MIKNLSTAIRKPVFAGLLALTACTGVVAQASDVTMFRSPSCGCCLKWVEHFRAYWKASGGEGEVKVVNNPDMASLKNRAGVPNDLRSCHTTLVGGYVIEGHVPAADVARLLKEKPKDVRGLAVAGMPMGSPGMEHGDHRQAYNVIAFGPDGQRVWKAYAAKGM